MNSHLPANALAVTPEDTTALCLACGFCCNGVLHTYTKVRSSEVKPLQRLGLTLQPIAGTTAFAFEQPCPQWQENRCAIYAQRPTSCRTYECLLYKKLAAGLISPAESMQSLQKAKNLLARRDDPALAAEGEQHAALLHSFLNRCFEPEHAFHLE